MRNALAVLGVVILIAAAFWGGTMYANAGTDSTAGALAPGETREGGFAGGPMGAGPMANLTEEQMAEMESMTQEERAAYLQELGVEMPDGAAGGVGGMRGGQLEGTVIDVVDDSLTIELDSGSQAVYTDEDTIVAYADGADGLGAGSEVVVIAEPAADGVTLASVVVVK